MKKINGRDLRVLHGGNRINYETELSYSESLEFVAVRANKDFDITISESKSIQIKHEDKIFLDRSFKFLDVITDADNNCLATDLLIFHNGNIDIVLKYLNIGVLDGLNDRFNRLEQLADNNKDYNRYIAAVEDRARACYIDQAKQYPNVDQTNI